MEIHWRGSGGLLLCVSGCDTSFHLEFEPEALCLDCSEMTPTGCGWDE